MENIKSFDELATLMNGVDCHIDAITEALREEDDREERERLSEELEEAMERRSEYLVNLTKLENELVRVSPVEYILGCIDANKRDNYMETAENLLRIRDMVADDDYIYNAISEIPNSELDAILEHLEYAKRHFTCLITFGGILGDIEEDKEMACLEHNYEVATEAIRYRIESECIEELWCAQPKDM